MSIQEYFIRELIFCPRTGHRGTGGQVTIHSTAKGLALWWRCSECDRWHMSEIKQIEATKDGLSDSR